MCSLDFMLRPLTWSKADFDIWFRLNSHFAWWRRNQSKSSTLPMALLILFYAQGCAFSQALTPLVDEIAQHYSAHSIHFFATDIAELSYADLIRSVVALASPQQTRIVT